ncbi:MAG TPA: alpha/beta family hydrolase [Candidatus Dormibacteraeota bacterium]|nr:alpha/beta family hydrolase [Candidatus Dormibacteraeota bacterium]
MGARPRRKAMGLLLAPGSGADRTQPALVAIDDAATALGVTVERMDFPYRRAGRRAPDREPVLLAAVREEAAALVARSGIEPGRLILGGRSMGGRICSMAVADGLPALALALVSYPLHPPGRPERLRTAHFPNLGVPCLFVSGTRDAFGTPAELEAATAAIPGPVTHVWLEGKDHGLKGADVRVAAAVTEWMAGLSGRLTPDGP